MFAKGAPLIASAPCHTDSPAKINEENYPRTTWVGRNETVE